MNKYIKGLSLLALIGVLMSCAPFNSSSTSNTELQLDSNNESSDISTSIESSEGNSGSSSSISQDNTSSSEPEVLPDNNNDALNDFKLANNIQDGTILHAWNWGLNEIKKALPEIANAGYSSVQTSPMQLQKDFYQGGHWKGQWWKLYQPLSLSVATANHALGTKNDLKALCDEADKYGIKVIVDVVANHLGGGNKYSFHSKVKDFEPEIYNENLFHKHSHQVDDASIQDIVQGYMGDFPDLKTEDIRVQNAVLDLLKEYVDCGVDGFRFDAAKHIETPDDGEFASNFWPYILDGVKDYALSKGLNNPYSYGEILHTAGDERDFARYMKMMSVTDSDASEHILSAALGSDIERVGFKDIYSHDIVSDHAVLWAESHDTYANDKRVTTDIPQNIINKGYAIAASKKDSVSLYFARPDNGFTLGSITKDNSWKSLEIQEVNKFHNHFINAKEEVIVSDTTYLEYKYFKDYFGLMIVETSDNKNIELNTQGYLNDGTYIDTISNSDFTCKDGVLKGTIGESGIATLFGEGSVNIPKGKPKINISNEGCLNCVEPINLTIKLENADYGTYKINEGEEINFKNRADLLLGENAFDETITLTVSAYMGSEKLTKTYTYKFIDPSSLLPTCINIPENYIKERKLAAWIWGKNGSYWQQGKLNENMFSFEIKDGDEHFLLASFNKNDAIDWNSKPKQTKDFSISESLIFDCGPGAWKK